MGTYEAFARQQAKPPRRWFDGFCSGAGRVRAALLLPVYQWVWANPNRRMRKLLQFAEVEAGGGRDLVRAAELTGDPVLRRRFLAHARDEVRHAEIFRARGCALRATLGLSSAASGFDWFAQGERGLDDVQVEHEEPGALLAFLHLSEAAAARDFSLYQQVLDHDPETRFVFEQVLRDETFHMRYTRAELDRIAPERQRLLIWKARLRRLWKAYLRMATAIAGIMATIILSVQYFVLLPLFALLAKRAARRDRTGWIDRSPTEPGL